MTPEEAKRAYHKKWRDSHRDRIKEYNKRYWEKKAAEAEQPEQEQTETGGESNG